MKEAYELGGVGVVGAPPVMLPRSTPVNVLVLPVLLPTETASGTTAAIWTRSWANDAGLYSLAAPRGRRYLWFRLAAGLDAWAGDGYQLSGMRSCPGVHDKVQSAASVIAKKDLRVSLSSMPFGYSAEWFDIKATVSLERKFGSSRYQVTYE